MRSTPAISTSEVVSNGGPSERARSVIASVEHHQSAVARRLRGRLAAWFLKDFGNQHAVWITQPPEIELTLTKPGTICHSVASGDRCHSPPSPRPSERLAAPSHNPEGNDAIGGPSAGDIERGPSSMSSSRWLQWPTAATVPMCTSNIDVGHPGKILMAQGGARYHHQHTAARKYRPPAWRATAGGRVLHRSATLVLWLTMP